MYINSFFRKSFNWKRKGNFMFVATFSLSVGFSNFSTSCISFNLNNHYTIIIMLLIKKHNVYGKYIRQVFGLVYVYIDIIILICYSKLL